MFKICSITYITYICIISAALSSNVEAKPTWFFKGSCHDSRVKRGNSTTDLTLEAGDPIHCDLAILSFLKNGRILLQFHTGIGILGFAGPVFDRKSNPNVANIPIDRIYPIRDLGMKSPEILDRSERGEGVLDDGIEGYCFMDNKNIPSLKEIGCTIKYEINSEKTVYVVKINIGHVTKTDLGL